MPDLYEKIMDEEFFDLFRNLILKWFTSFKGFFNIVYPIHFGSQRNLNYLHSGMDRLDVELKQSK